MFKKLREAIHLYKLYSKGRDRFVNVLKMSDKSVFQSKTTIGTAIALLAAFLTRHVVPLVQGEQTDWMQAISELGYMIGIWITVIGGRDVAGRILTTMKENGR